MIVYGDWTEPVRTADRLRDIGADLRWIATLDPGLSRHAALAKTFVALGQIVQGVADADRTIRGADGASTAETELMKPLCAVAQALIFSWDSGFASLSPLPTVSVPPNAPDEIDLRLPEGYAFYGVYPEAYARAARSLGLAGRVRVIGIRSIGTSLAAVVSAALDAPPPFTVRPMGCPFHRHIAFSLGAAARLLDGPDPSYVVVDEGPGLSGSSFAAVADFLAGQAVPLHRVHFLPSHAGEPGSQATERIRKCWAQVARTAADSEALLLPYRLAGWAADLLGPLDSPLVDISGGKWRSLVWPDERCWPAAIPHQERRKFLAHAGGETWLLKFAGLGTEGENKLATGRLLHAAGLVPEVRGLLYGFLVQRWEDAAPCTSDDLPSVDRAARYLAARALLLAPGKQGASTADLYEMARFNISQALGSRSAAPLTRWEPLLDELQVRSIPMQTDNRCDAYEWLRLRNGRVLKADALDHHAGHDLIGCQDLAWDVAGVSVEFGLTARQTDRLIAGIERISLRRIDRVLLDFLTPCYLAFRLGAATLAADALDDWPAEAGRNREAARRYAARIGVVPAGEGVSTSSGSARAGAARMSDGT